MADADDDLRRARDEAQRAREEADRLRNEARDLARRLSREARDRSREERTRSREERERAREERDRSRHHHGPGAFPFGPGGPTPPRVPGSGESNSSDGVRVENAFAFEGVRAVVIDQTAGRLTVRPCAPGETPGVTASGGRTAPRLDVQRDGDRLIVEVKLLKGWLFRRKQGATTVVRLGEGFATLKVNLGYGNLELRGLACDSMKVDVGAGELQAYGLAAALDADLGAGKIAIHDHVGLAKCDTGTGDVLLDVAGVAEGDYRVDVGIGRAEVRLAPGGGPVHVSANSGIGRARVDVPNGPENAPTRVKATSGIGEVVVRHRSPGGEPARPPATAKPQRGAPRAAAAAAQRSREAEQFRVLQLLEQGRISSQDAAELIAALQGAAPPVGDEEEAPGEETPPSTPSLD
ncbi:MAG: hypothetical protein HY875_16070 [Chloroflexi bacterium]|nr:hypothetical protein [Chloroflexota bacterium]